MIEIWKSVKYLKIIIQRSPKCLRLQLLKIKGLRLRVLKCTRLRRLRLHNPSSNLLQSSISYVLNTNSSGRNRIEAEATRRPGKAVSDRFSGVSKSTAFQWQQSYYFNCAVYYTKGARNKILNVPRVYRIIFRRRLLRFDLDVPYLGRCSFRGTRRRRRRRRSSIWHS